VNVRNVIESFWCRDRTWTVSGSDGIWHCSSLCPMCFGGGLGSSLHM